MSAQPDPIPSSYRRVTPAWSCRALRKRWTSTGMSSAPRTGSRFPTPDGTISHAEQLQGNGNQLRLSWPDAASAYGVSAGAV
jgi:hypothetical protein